MPPKKKAAAPVFDLSRLQRAPHYIWREIEREGREPLRVKLRDLSIRETNEIPIGSSVKMSDVYPILAPYVVEWTLEALNTETGETIPVPPPAAAGWEVFELLNDEEGAAVLTWLKYPQAMKGLAQKKAQNSSTTTPTPANTSA